VRVVILCVVLVAGCDVVWSIDHVDKVNGGDAGVDAPSTISCVQYEHDEDGDRFPDECDRCPGIADNQDDGDGDSVGDACDPSGTTNERVELFLSFADGDTRWTPVDGTWPLDGENLAYTSVSLMSNAYDLYTGPVPSPPFVVEYAYTVDAIDTVGSLFTVVLDADAAGTGVNCGHRRTVGPLRDVVRATSPQAPAAELEIMTVTPVRYRVTAAYDRDRELRCALTSVDGATMGAARMAIASAVPAGTIGFHSLQIGVRVHYVAIYKTY